MAWAPNRSSFIKFSREEFDNLFATDEKFKQVALLTLVDALRQVEANLETTAFSVMQVRLARFLHAHIKQV